MDSFGFNYTLWLFNGKSPLFSSVNYHVVIEALFWLCFIQIHGGFGQKPWMFGGPVDHHF
jgi:hypothetical protein